MVVIFVEDKALKCLVKSIIIKFRKDYSVRMTDPGGWTEVIKNVVNASGRIFAVGVIEGDIREEAEAHAQWSEVSGKIFITSGHETETYLFNKKEMIDSSRSRMPEDFNRFKHFMNKEINEVILNEICRKIAGEQCDEIQGFKAFLVSQKTHT